MKVKDPISALTHLIGAVLACIAAATLIIKAIEVGSMTYIITFTIFGLSLILLYTASTVYHIIDQPESLRRKYKRIDHMMIFILIAGTYTPICLISLKGTLGVVLLVVIWGIAIAGIIMKAFWLDAPRWLTTGMYLLMGWLVIVAIYPVFKAMPQEGFRWLVAGGITYTIGGIIYGLKWPLKHHKWFGFHELFHLFVMGGSACHYVLMMGYV